MYPLIHPPMGPGPRAGQGGGFAHRPPRRLPVPRPGPPRPRGRAQGWLKAAARRSPVSTVRRVAARAVPAYRDVVPELSLFGSISVPTTLLPDGFLQQ